MNMRILLLLPLLLPAGRALPAGEAAAGESVTFLPGRDGTLPVWLAAGPFAQPQPQLEN